MKKGLFITALLCVFTITMGVFANNNIFMQFSADEPAEANEITSALRSSNVLKSCTDPVVVVDEEFSEPIVADLQMYNMSNENMFDMSNGVRLYSVCVDSTAQSIYSLINEENDMWIIPGITDGKTSYAYLKKGTDLPTAEEQINSLNVSQKHKNKMLEMATERANKWYVAYVEKPSSSYRANSFLSESNLESTLNTNNITGVEDIKYIKLQNNDKLAICVKTSNSEYIIPYDSEETQVYSVQETILRLSE